MAALDFIIQVEQAYARLIGTALADREAGLGGKLLYAGELDEQGRVMITAANIAGAATLAATADRDAQKQAIREGITDFLVNSLDEALRILKNELRKRETVAVCVGMAPEAVDREMKERGVLPDMQRADLPMAQIHEALRVEDGEQADFDQAETKALVTWSVASAPVQWLPALDAIALDCLDADAWQARRWLRLAPRFLGRLAQEMHLISADREFSARFIERTRTKVERGEIAVAVEVRSYYRRMQYLHRLTPGEAAGDC